ncbi:hypothetical protein MED193_07354 [Roseobacter sp. MED193]|nr:hypothetical protein MED193_07354 [Roseobacter sp. MED193]
MLQADLALLLVCDLDQEAANTKIRHEKRAACAAPFQFCISLDLARYLKLRLSLI